AGPVRRATSCTHPVRCSSNSVGAEEPRSAIIREIDEELRRAHSGGGKIALDGGPAIVGTGAGGHLVRLIEGGCIDRLFAGSGFAAYDVERALFGTSLGLSPDVAIARGGHENHLRAINTIREVGGIAAAVREKILTSGIMHACVQHDVDIVLIGAIGDEGPLPGVTTDVIECEKILRDKLRDVTHVVLLATLRYSLALGAFLANNVKTVCVDIDPPAVERAVERQPLQSIGLVTDVEPFLRELDDCLSGSKVSQ